MPMYEYRCTECEYQFELRQKFSDPPADECPECGKEAEKIISSTSFSLKGNGWFAQGYCPKTDAPKPAGCPSGGCCGA